MIATLLSSLWSRLTGYAIAIGAALAILFAAYSKGKSDADSKRDRDRLNELNKARKVEHEVDRRSDDDVHRDLGRWLRD